ncbi:hypothetical protein ACS5PN_26385 [Roseateles sp. NT4]|uniref:hypothetical protein n=1 Tax=Roseateles sp. NT4 TaxID=3453715 RepID=UPI003EECA047
MTARRRRVLVVALLAVAFLALWMWMGRRGIAADAEAMTPPAASASAATAVLARVMATPASAGVAAAAPAALVTKVVDKRAVLANQMKADWCGFGAEQRRQWLAAVNAASSAASVAPPPDRDMLLSEEVGTELLAEATAEVVRRWVAVLMQRGDPRSQALADILGSDAEANARLQRRARSSADPMVTVLALRRPCASGACINVEASQWSRLEPENLQAWLALAEAPGGAGRSQQAYILERAASEARYSRSYQQELQALLLSLPQTEKPGLQAQAEAQLIIGMVSAWPWRSARPLLDSCRGGMAEAGVAQRCETAANLLWQQDSLMDRAMAIALARPLLPVRPDLRNLWEGRAREYEAVGQWTKSALQRVIQKLVPDEEALVSRCGALAGMRELQREMAVQTDWVGARAEMREAKANEAELSALWRQAAGRSVLEPPRTASAPKS